MERQATVARKTAETEVTASVNLDRSAATEVDTGIAFLDHMLDALARHSRIGITVAARGDLVVDDHHTTEDVAICLGRALAEALGDRRGIERFGSAYAPLDEALVRAVVDLSARPWPEVALGFRRESIGAMATENIVHFFRTFATEARLALHLDEIRSENDHHLAEAAFKALALALRSATAIDRLVDDIPSTKGVL